MANETALGKVNVFISETQFQENKQELNENEINLVHLPMTDYIVESYDNGTEWYKKWKSGWIQQGGRYAYTKKTAHTVTLVIPFTNTNYDIRANSVTQGFTSYGDGVQWTYSLTTTNFQANSENSGTATWRAEGY